MLVSQMKGYFWAIFCINWLVGMFDGGIIDKYESTRANYGNSVSILC